MSVNGFKINGNTERYNYYFLDNLPDLEGTICETLDEFNNGIESITGLSPQAFRKGVYKTVGVGEPVVLSDSDEFNCARFEVNEGDVVEFNCAGSNGLFRLWVLIDSNGNAVERSSINLVGRRKIIIPSGVSEIAVNNYLNSMPTGYFVLKGNPSLAKESNVTYRLVEFTQGNIDQTGLDGRSDYYCCSDYIPYDHISHIYKPIGIGIIVSYYSEKNPNSFITRDTNTLGSQWVAIDYSRYAIECNLSVNNAKYVRFSVERNDENGEEIVSSPEDIANSNLRIDISGCSDEIYGRIISNENKKASKYYEFSSGTIDSSGSIAASTDYWKTGMISIDEIDRLIKPAGLLAMVSRFDSSGVFISRSSIDDELSVDYDASKIKYLYKRNDENYLVISVAKYSSVANTTIPASIDEILAMGFEISVTSSMDDLKRKLFLAADNKIPDYYFSTGYLDEKINNINRLEDSVSEKTDNFIFITDYHFSKNAEKSPAIIKHIVEKTGITKLIFGGDAGRSQLEDYKYAAARENCNVLQKLRESAPEFYAVVGNHDWNDQQDVTHEGSKQGEVFSTSGVVNFYIGENRIRAEEISDEGNYYIDNKSAKIRYFFLQETGQAKTTDDTIEWFANRLLSTPSGYYVVVFCHYAYTGAPNATFNPSSIIGRGNLSVIRISQIMGAVKSKQSVTVKRYNRYDTSGTQTGSYTFDFSGTDLIPIAIISGHTHWDASLTTSQSEYGILTIATTTDAAGYNQNGQTGVAEPRTFGTIEEQAFDVVQIDLTSRTVYMTRIGGGSDREFTF